MTLQVVQTESRSPLEALWREFPQIKNSTVVMRTGMSGGERPGMVERTFRLLDGQYIRIRSKVDGNTIVPIEPEEIEDYEAAWHDLGQKALGEPNTCPHGIMFASNEFFDLVAEIEDARCFGDDDADG
jgi:hypothetical protein